MLTSEVQCTRDRTVKGYVEQDAHVGVAVLFSSFLGRADRKCGVYDVEESKEGINSELFNLLTDSIGLFLKARAVIATSTTITS